MKKYLLVVLFAICILPVFSQNTFTGSLATTDPTFNRPDEGVPPVTLSSIGTNVYYNVIPLNVTTAGLITVISNSTWDNFLVLYNPGGFNPASPLENALVANDDYSGPNAGFTYNFTSPGVYYLVMCSFKNNATGGYTITTSAVIVLPLKLISFTATKSSGNSNIINWSSASETNLNTYQVQRSADYKNFNDIQGGNIVAKNNTANTAYSCLDNSPGIGYNYYRLKITERLGGISYSPVAIVKNNGIGIMNLKIFPNPAAGYLQIEVKSMQQKKAFVSVINAGGEVMRSGQYIFNNQSILSIDIRKLPAGKYFLKTIVDNKETIGVFVKN